MRINPLNPSQVASTTSSESESSGAPSSKPAVRDEMVRARGETLPAAAPQRGTRLNQVTARLVGTYAQREAAALQELGCRPRSQAAAEEIGLVLPRWDEVDSRELIAALGQVDCAALERAGVPRIAVFDFDNTLMTGELWVSFLAVAAHHQALSPESRPAMIAEICRRAPEAVRFEALEQLDVNRVMERAIELFHAKSLTPTDMFSIGLGSLRGMTPAKADALAEELFERGAPGQKPYKLNGFDPFPGPGDSAAELVEVLAARGIEPYVITAGFTFLARRGCQYLGIPPERVFGADLEEENGLLTGKAPDIIAVGKDNIVRDQIGTPPVFVFGDSPRSDAPMMALALGRGFMVEPSQTFIDQTREQRENHVVLRFGPLRGD